MRRRRAFNEEGFSLLEMVTVVAIVAILVAVAVASFAASAAQSRRITCLHHQRLLDSVLSQYQVDHGGVYPMTLADTRPYTRWGGGAFAACPQDGKAFDYDSDDGNIACSNHPR